MGYARQFDAEIVNYADDFCVVGKTSAAQMLLAVNRIMTHLELTLNVEKTRCLRCPEQPLEFLGYRIGIDYCHRGTGSYIGTRPSKASVQIVGISVNLNRNTQGCDAALSGWRPRSGCTAARDRP